MHASDEPHYEKKWKKRSSGSKSVTEFGFVAIIWLRLCYDKSHDVIGMVVIAWALGLRSGSGVGWRTRRCSVCISHETLIPLIPASTVESPYPFVDRRNGVEVTREAL